MSVMHSQLVQKLIISYSELEKLFNERGFECSNYYVFNNYINHYFISKIAYLRNIFFTTKFKIRKVKVN